MRLWTIQTEGAYRRLQERGILYGDWRRVERSLFKPAYKWLCGQMEKRGIPLKGRPPMWAWTHRPDLRSAGHLGQGERGVRIEIDVPESLVLVSNFEAWHCVLNNHFLVTRDDEVEGMFDRPRHEVEESWAKIFDLEHITGLAGYGNHNQATFPTIEADYIMSVTPFVGR